MKKQTRNSKGVIFGLSLAAPLLWTWAAWRAKQSEFTARACVSIAFYAWIAHECVLWRGCLFGRAPIPWSEPWALAALLHIWGVFCLRPVLESMRPKVTDWSDR